MEAAMNLKEKTLGMRIDLTRKEPYKPNSRLTRNKVL